MILPFIFGYTLVTRRFTKKSFYFLRELGSRGTAKNETNETEKEQKRE